MPNKDSYAVMLNYSIDNLSLNLNKDFNFPTTGEIEINPTFETFYKKLDQDRYEITIKFKLISEEQHQKPFRICFEINGLFKIKSFTKAETETLVKTTSLMTLFPYLRQVVTQLSLLTGLPPLVLPIMNMQALSEKMIEIK